MDKEILQIITRIKDEELKNLAKSIVASNEKQLKYLRRLNQSVTFLAIVVGVSLIVRLIMIVINSIL